MLTDKNNFGPTAESIVRYSGFTNKGTNATANKIPIDNVNHIFERDSNDYTGSGKDAEFRRDVLGGNGIEPMDIVIIGWTGEIGDAKGFWHMTTNQAATLKEFCEGGGVLLVFDECENVVEPVLRAIFENNSIESSHHITRNPAGSVYRFENIGDDPILNGPFGNITGLTWGEDASFTKWAQNIPLENAVLYSTNKNITSSTSEAIEGAATIVRHRKLPFLWVGDGGFCSGPPDAVAYPSSIICPFMLAQKTINGRVYGNYPVKKTGYRPIIYVPNPPAYDVYNSIFTANALPGL